MRRGRRGPKAPPPKPFDAAWTNIDKLEINAVQRMVTAAFTPEQAVRWLFEDSVVDRLKAAFPLAQQPRYAEITHINEQVPLPFSGGGCGVSINAKAIGMQVPMTGLMNPDPERGEPMLAAIKDAYDQHRQFEKVRRVVRWLNEYATLGAGRHYCPWLTSVMPEDHEFQKLDGVIYREPARGMTEVVEHMRECHSIMATALLAGEPEATRTGMFVTFNGHRQMFSGATVDTYTSQRFPVL